MSKKIINQFICSRMMLLEHRERLNERRRKLQREEKYHMPFFDEQQWKEFQFILNRSIQYGCKIEVTVLTKKGHLKVRGVVKAIDPVSGQIGIVTENGLRKLNTKEIVAMIDV